MRLSIFIFIPWFASAALLSCKEVGKPDVGVASPKSNEIRKEYRKGPVCVRLSADKSSMSIAELLVLSLEAEVDEGFEAELPGFGEKLGEFGIKDYREDPRRLTPQNKILSRKTYTLEPFLSGDYTLESMLVRFRKKSEGGKMPEGGSGQGPAWDDEIATEAFTIKVTSLLEKDQKELALNPIRGPVSLPSGPFAYFLALGLLAVALVGGGVVFFLRSKRGGSRNHEAPPVPAHELAFGQLEAIIDEKLIDRGLYKLFFSRISDVLRAYIENRFGIHAPKQTTEEFFAGLGRNASFSAEQKGLLVEFLHDCDLVKFAELQPSEAQALKAMESCKAFIGATSTSQPQ
ncbi:MAG: hypothetical protein AB9873_02070 [Syntrophobacteraceae bacterium]